MADLEREEVDHGVEFERDREGWWRAVCDCGWSSPPCPGEEEAADFYGDHRAFADG